MKNTAKSLSILSFVIVALLLVNCGGGGGEAAPEKIALEQLKKKTWSIKTVGGAKLGNTDRTADFTGFKIAFTGDYSSNSPSGPYTFTVSGTRPDPSPWPGSGSWTFAGEPSKNSGAFTTAIIGGINYGINSQGELQLDFTCSSCNFDGARTSQVNGDWTFILN
jgi:hypothetical protein